MVPVTAAPAEAPAVRRLFSLARLGRAELTALDLAMQRPRTVRGKRELVREGTAVAEPLLLLDGWAARVRYLPDGRRQIISLVLPGDLIGYCRHPRPLALSSMVSVTDCTVCPAPVAEPDSALAEAYATSSALDEAYLLAAVTRLGRLNAQERLADFFLETFGRLTVAGLATADSFDLPLTQETLADALGLTSVHVNRMLQLARQQGDISLKGGRLTLHDVAKLAQGIGWAPARVSG